jgi:hypothetical protein
MMVAGGDHRTLSSLNRAANRLEDFSRRIMRATQATQDYQRKVGPITQGVEHLVGGSATGKDKQIALLLTECTQSVARSAAASHQAAQIARKLAAHALAEAQQIRRQQAERSQGQRNPDKEVAGSAPDPTRDGMAHRPAQVGTEVPG